MPFFTRCRYRRIEQKKKEHFKNAWENVLVVKGIEPSSSSRQNKTHLEETVKFNNPQQDILLKSVKRARRKRKKSRRFHCGWQGAALPVVE